MLDVSQGMESYPIVYDNPGGSDQSTLLDLIKFKYTKTNVPGPGVDRESFSEQFCGCECQRMCIISTCSCLQQFGQSFEETGQLKSNVMQGKACKPILECGSACPCNPEICSNRVVQRGIQYSFRVFHTGVKGYGLMLGRNNPCGIKLGSFVCEYAGEVLGEAEAKKRMAENDMTGRDNYVIAVREHTQGSEICSFVDPRCLGNVGRFINHSCNPNLIMLPVRVNHQVPRLALFARRDITPGEELTFDYSGTVTFHKSSDVLPEVETQNFTTKNVMPSLELSDVQPEEETCNSFRDHLQPSLEPSKNYDSSNEPLKKKIKLNVTDNLNISSASADIAEQSMNICINSDSITDSVSPEQLVLTLHGEAVDRSRTNSLENKTSAAVPRKPCFCYSKDCHSFLPFDKKFQC